jgi:hypothetical protein
MLAAKIVYLKQMRRAWKRIPVTIAVETMERAYLGIRSGRIAGNERHRGTAV